MPVFFKQLILIGLVFPVFAFAQDGSQGGSIEPQKDLLATSTPAEIVVPETLTSSPRATSSSTSILDVPREVVPSPTPTTPVPAGSVPPPVQDTMQGENPEPPRTNPIILIALAALAVIPLGYLVAQKLKNKKIEGDEQEKDSNCLNLKQLLEKKLKEVTDLRAQVESRAKGIAREKIKEVVKGTPAEALLKTLEEAERECKRLKALYEECVIEFRNKTMKKITPHLWFDKEAKEASAFYVSVFGNGSKITNTTTITGMPSGDCDIVSFEILGYALQAISAGPYFKFNPSVSFMVNFDPSKDKDDRARIDEVWGKLSEGGTALMPIGKYPFSERYGWIKDKYGLSWQLILTNPEGEERPPIIPSLLFVSDTCDKAEEATNFYFSIFKDAKRGTLARYPAGMEPSKEGAIMFTDFTLENQWFAAMDGSSTMHKFAFNEAVSFMVNCETQEEIDYYWEKLSAVPESEQCGWLKDKYGVSWQIVPNRLEEMMKSNDKEKINRVTQAFLKMKKFDIAALERAAGGK